LGIILLRELYDLPGTLLREHWMAFKNRRLGIWGRDLIGSMLDWIGTRVNDKQRVWRFVITSLLLVSFAGPWTFDLLSVPREYACTAPHVRLDGDFCGVPIIGLLAFFQYLLGFPFLISRMIRFPQFFSPELLFFLPLLLPVFTILLLIRSRGARSPEESKIFFWSLSLGINLFMGLVGTIPRPIPVLAPWGIWVFNVSATAALIRAILVLRAERTGNQTAA
jgi:hypothetical protein